MRILHVAFENIAGVPGTLVKAERKLGHYSRLITFYESPRGHRDDIILNLPFSDTSKLMPVKKTLKAGTYRHEYRKGNPPLWEPGVLERFFYTLRDSLWERRIKPLMDFILSFDVFFLDGGLGFLRNGKIIDILKSKGKKVVLLYTGSDLRSRGALPHLERMTDRIYTLELDHTFIHPDAEHFMFPYEVDRFEQKELLNGEKPVVCHAPTNRYLKGTEYLIDAVKNLSEDFDFEFLLMEDISHEEVIHKKREHCDLLVDQLTDLGGYGYGMNSMESLSMGIPCVTFMNKDYENYLPDHPFINADRDNIESVLEEILKNPDVLVEKGKEGREWVKENHDYIKVSRSMLKGLR